MSEARVQADAPATKRFEFRIDGRKLVVPAEPELIMGRRMEEADHVDVDLSRFGAAEAGVSRRHAQLILDSGDVFVTDLGSTNGTRLNGKPLKANQPYRLRNDDELALAQLKVVVRFLTTQ